MTEPQGVDRLDPVLVEQGMLLTLNLSDRTVGLIRDSLDGRRADAARDLDTGEVEVGALTLGVGHGAVDVRVYRGTAEKPGPCLVFFHSGALVLGNLDTDHARCVLLARQARCVVVSVDYRLAPEAGYPAAFDDCFGAATAVAREHLRLGVDPTRIAVGGSSAGAGLAAAVALAARDRGGPQLCFQLLHQPMLDATCASPSMAEFTTTPAFDSSSARYAWASYLHGQPATPYASAALAENLQGLAPAFIACSEVDPLRDEAIEYAARLLQSGVPAELHVIPATCHGFDSVAPTAEVSVRAVAEQAAALARAFDVASDG